MFAFNNPLLVCRPSLSGSKRRSSYLAAAAVASIAALAVVPVALAQQTAPAAADDKATPEVEVIFAGFARRADDGAQVFVRMTGEVPVETARNGKTLTYRLAGAKLGVANNANPLPTRHFGPPVSNVSLVATEGGVNLVIELSANDKAGATYRVVKQGGLSTLEVELPPSPAR
jgi:hypothetical protein